MNILIADSGSTKTDWACGAQRFSGPGLNPVQMDQATLAQRLKENLSGLAGTVDAVYFYGAGCNATMSPVMAAALAQELGQGADIHVASDMLGAARGMCGAREGIVCILGTGSNSCLFDGQAIAAQVPTLGYVLGDEGSGAYIGRLLLTSCLRGLLGKDLQQAFVEETGLTADKAIEQVYRQPGANRFLASLVPFCERHREDPKMEEFLVSCLHDFASRVVKLYERPELPVHFVGGIAYTYEQELRKAFAMEHLQVGDIVRAPLEKMVAYHESAD